MAWDNIPFSTDVKEIAAYTGAVCWGSLAQRNEVSRNTIYQFLDHTPEDCLKIFDINLRQNFYTKEIICESLKRCNVLKINDEELITIGRLFGYPGLDIENKCWLILGKYNLDMLVLTCGVMVAMYLPQAASRSKKLQRLRLPILLVLATRSQEPSVLASLRV